MLPWPVHPSALDPVEITPAEAVVLRAAADNRGVAYNNDTVGDRARARHFERMAQRHLVTFTDAAAGGWERGMWAAHLTAIGWNAIFRWGNTGERHVGIIDIYGRRRTPCDGHWSADGTCAECGATRPLDAAAHDAYLDALNPEARQSEIRAPRLWCVEHGRMRRRDITTQKVCMLPGSDFHDGGLARL